MTSPRYPAAPAILEEEGAKIWRDTIGAFAADGFIDPKSVSDRMKLFAFCAAAERCSALRAALPRSLKKRMPAEARLMRAEAVFLEYARELGATPASRAAKLASSPALAPEPRPDPKERARRREVRQLLARILSRRKPRGPKRRPRGEASGEPGSVA